MTKESDCRLWAIKDPLLTEYHDHEWCHISHDDRYISAGFDSIILFMVVFFSKIPWGSSKRGSVASQHTGRMTWLVLNCETHV